MEHHTKWTIIVICLMLIWGSLWLLFYLKADEVTKHPCSICAEKQGKEVFCVAGSAGLVSRTYYPNGSVYQSQKAIPYMVDNINLTLPK